MPSEPLRDFTLKPGRWQRELRAVGLLLVALSAWFWPSPLREALWLSLVYLLRQGILSELAPVRYREGRLMREGRVREAGDAEALIGTVVYGLWPRFGVRFPGQEVWWLPLGRGWTLLWEELRRANPALPDWRETPLCPYYLMLADSDPPPEAVPGELIERVAALGLKGKLRPSFLSLVAFSAVGGALSAIILPPGLGPFGELGFVVVFALALDGAYRVWKISRIKQYCRGT